MNSLPKKILIRKKQSSNIISPLEELKQELERVRPEPLGSLNPQESLCIPLQSIQNNNDILKIQELIQKYGLVFITEAIVDPQQVQLIKSRIVDVYNQMFGADMHGLAVKDIRQIPSQKLGGIMGNKGFAYLYKQPLLKTQTPTLRIKEPNDSGNSEPKGCHPIYMDHNPVYRDVNLATLNDPQNRHLLSVLLALTHHQKTMISWDSVKVATNPKSGANPFTDPHIDFYSDITERFQALINLEEQATKLFYSPGTNDPKIRSLMVKLQNDPNFYITDGFKALKPDVAATIRPFMIAPPKGSLILWKSGIVHAEYTSADQLSPQGYFYPHKDQALIQRNNQLTIRMVLGTHKPTELTEFELKTLAIAGQMGLIPHRYIHGNNQGVVLNKMHKGKTQYKKARIQPPKEQQLFQETIPKLEDSKWVEHEFDKMDPILKHISGIPQPFWPELKSLLS